jgi:uncharacterized damage-inducible protein DinB
MPAQTNAVRQQFNKLEEKKKKLMHLLLTLPGDMYTKQPSSHQWSVAQAANHIFLSEKLSLAYLKKKLAYPDAIPRYHPKSWGGVLLVKLVFMTNYKWKAPQAINMWEAQQVLSPAELEQKWNSLREELISFLEKHSPSFGKHLVFRHPYAGRMTMTQMLIFMNDHMGHHLKQINRILKQNGYPVK